MLASFISQPEVIVTSWVEILAASTLVGFFITWWHHNICIEHRCFHKGHADPKHGHPLCKKHQGKVK